MVLHFQNNVILQSTFYPRMQKAQSLPTMYIQITLVVLLSQLDWTGTSPSLHGNAMAKSESMVDLLNFSILFFPSVMISYLPR